MPNLPTALRLVLVAAAVALAVVPFFAGTFYVQLVTKIMIMAIFAMSLDLLVGFTGLVSLGHAAFFGLAAYVLVLLSPSEYEAANLWMSLPAAMAAAAVAALVIGFLVLRTRGIYFIMVTLAFGQMMFYFFHDAEWAGGADGVYIYFKPETTLFGWKPFNLESTFQFYYLVLALMALSYVLLQVILRAPFGHVLVGIRTNEQRMRSLGYAVFRYKLVGFTIAGAFAGLAGYLAATQFGFVNPQLLAWHQSGDVLLMVILGGMGTLFGPVLGAFALVLMQEFLSHLTKHWLLLMGSFVIAVVLLLPDGIGGLLLRLTRGRTQGAAHDDDDA